MGSFIQHTIVPPFFLNIRGSYCNTQTNCQMSPLYDLFERYRVSWYYRHQVGKYLFPQKCCIVIFRCFTIELWLISFFSQSFFWIRYRILLIDWYYEIEFTASNAKRSWTLQYCSLFISFIESKEMSGEKILSLCLS